MGKYQNKKLHITVVDFIFIIVFLATSLISAFCLNNLNETKGTFNIEKTDVDYTITAPSKEQVDEIKALSHIDSVVPYIFRSVNCNVNGKNFKSNLFVIENEADMKYTPFSEELLFKKSSSDYDNALSVSKDFANNAKLSLGDSISVTINEQSIKFTVAAIYESDYRYVGGTIICVMNNDVASAFNSNYKYSGAFIGSNDLSATDTYIAKYKPLGDLRPREEFESDEMYQMYLDERESTDNTKSTFYRQAFLKEQHNRNDDKVKRELCMVLAAFASGLLIAVVWIICKTRSYIKNDVIKDIRNNFDISREKKMFNSYFVLNSVMYIIAFSLSVIAGYFLFCNEIFTVITYSELGALLLILIITHISTTGKLKKEFATKVEEEKKKAKNG